MPREESLTGGTLRTISPHELQALLDQEAVVLVDVRTPQEYGFQRIPGALLLPMAELDPSRLPRGGDRTLVLHCGSGMRSRRVAERMFDAGYRVVTHLGGGLSAWTAAGLPYLTVDPMTGAVKETTTSGKAPGR